MFRPCLSVAAVALVLTAASLAAQEPTEAAAGPPTQTTDAATTPKPISPTAKKSWTVPAGTKVLLQLRSAVNTKTARPGDAVYLASTFPVVVGNKVLIPAGVYVQGVVDRVERPGRIKGRAKLEMHFTSIIFPNGSVVEVPGVVNSLPGAKDRQVKDQEGTIEQDGNKSHDVGNAAKIALEGTSIGAIGGAAAGHAGEGAAIGGLGGLAVGTAVALFTRGSDLVIDNGTAVEMVLQRPLILEEDKLSSSGGAQPALVPSPDQPRPLQKKQRGQLLCPPGSLGCE